MAKYTEEFIFSYLRKRLSPSEEEAFEAILADDEILRKKTDDLRYIVLAEDLADIENTRNLLKTSKAVREGQRRWKIILGAVIFLVALAILWGVYGAGEPTPTSDETERKEVPEEKIELKEPPAEVIPVTPSIVPDKSDKTGSEGLQEEVLSPVFAVNVLDTVRSLYRLPDGIVRTLKNDRDSTMLLRATEILKAGDAKQATMMLTDILLAAPTNLQAKNALAHAHFMSGNYTESREVFHELRESSESPNRDEYEWYLLLAILAENNGLDTASKSLFEQLLDIEAFHNYQGPAKNLLSKIE